MNKRKFKIGELYRVGLDSFGNRMTETGNVIRIRTIEYVNNKRMIRYQTIKPNGGGGDGMFYIYSNFANCLKKYRLILTVKFRLLSTTRQRLPK